MDAGLLQQTFIYPEPRFVDYPFYARAERKTSNIVRSMVMAAVNAAGARPMQLRINVARVNADMPEPGCRMNR